MKIFEITALLMVLTALFSFINYRVLRMPTAIGVMFIALVVSLGIVALGWIGVDIGQSEIAEFWKRSISIRRCCMACCHFCSLPGRCRLSLRT